MYCEFQFSVDSDDLHCFLRTGVSMNLKVDSCPNDGSFVQIFLSFSV